VVLERNRFYRGSRPHRVARIAFELNPDPDALVDMGERGDIDYLAIAPPFARRAEELAAKYGTNKQRFLVRPIPSILLLALNTERPLFRNNPQLRRAVNYALDREAVVGAEAGRYYNIPTAQFIPPNFPGYRPLHVYPRLHPNLVKARALARGHLRNGKAILYTCSGPQCLAQAQVVKDDFAKIGLDVDVKAFPGNTRLDRAGVKGEPFDIVRIGWIFGYPDPYPALEIFDGRTITGSGNSDVSYYNSPRFNDALDKASRLLGTARARAFAKLDLFLTRTAAPAIPYATGTLPNLFSSRTGCIVMNPFLDLAAVCFK
jgi:peptide/nickel transport system substrate-binding protein